MNQNALEAIGMIRIWVFGFYDMVNATVQAHPTQPTFSNF